MQLTVPQGFPPHSLPRSLQAQISTFEFHEGEEDCRQGSLTLKPQGKFHAPRFYSYQLCPAPQIETMMTLRQRLGVWSPFCSL